MTKGLTLPQAADKMALEGGQIGLSGWWCEFAEGVGPLRFPSSGNYVRLDHEEITAECWQHRTTAEAKEDSK